MMFGTIDRDNYCTPKEAWTHIEHLIPRDKTLWDPFWCSGYCALQEMGYNVIHEPVDFFTTPVPPTADMIVTNPPFSKTKEVLRQLREINLPFILILPVQKLNTKYMKELYGSDPALSVHIPPRRIHFGKYEQEKNEINWTDYKQCSFDCFYYVWGIPAEKQLNWL